MLTIKTNYSPDKYTLENERAIVGIGSKPGEFYPYDLLLGALSSCFYYTLIEILEKRKVEIPIVEVIVTGEKRTEVPTTLEWVNMEITVTGKVDEKQFQRSVDLAAKYCSIHETISKVAKMSHEVRFNPVS
ncbi:MAG TPA: OsmC family protein [Anaerolineaceae bacterium]|mgnify:FL=1|jgi:putative redox protein|nr:OsmC family protein [Anaerolineaceae bacterium]